MLLTGRATGAAPFLGIVASLVFSTVIATAWVEQSRTRTVGGATVDETVTTTGMELVPLGVVAGLAAVVCGVGVLATRGTARRLAALLLTCSGIGAIGAAVAGVMRAVAMDGGLTVAPWIALPAAIALTAAGLLGLGPPARRMPARYDVDADPGDQEWRMATDPGDARRLDETAG
jgi:hypothetical protein